MDRNEFSLKLREAVSRNRSRLILALDYSDVFLRSETRVWKVKKERLLKKALEIIESTAEHLAAIKINMQLKNLLAMLLSRNRGKVKIRVKRIK